MSNFKKANNLASEWIDSMGGLDNIHYIFGDDVSGLIQAFRDEGLLAPDLPEPYRPGIFKVASPHLDVRSVQAAEDQIVLHGYKMRHASISEARSLALAILAACEYAEKEQDNE